MIQHSPIADVLFACVLLQKVLQSARPTEEWGPSDLNLRADWLKMTAKAARKHEAPEVCVPLQPLSPNAGGRLAIGLGKSVVTFDIASHSGWT